MGGRNRRVSTRAEGHLESEVSEQDAEGLLTFVEPAAKWLKSAPRRAADVVRGLPETAGCSMQAATPVRVGCNPPRRDEGDEARAKKARRALRTMIAYGGVPKP